MDRLYNLTPHPVVIYDQAGKNIVVTIPSKGELRLASTTQRELEPLDGPVRVVTPQQFTGLATTGDGYALWLAHPDGDFIVSAFVAQWVASYPRERANRALYVPATGPNFSVRDDKGGIKGVKALEKY